MLREYYKYLANRIEEYFKISRDIEGYKYSVMFESSEQVQNLYKQMEMLDRAEPFSYKNHEGVEVYKSFYLRFGEKKLIIAATINNIRTDFLTTLRNSIGTDKEGFEGAGIFIIYDSKLDSISNATESFQKEGMPFHVDKIVENIKQIVEASDMSNIDKQILSYELNKRMNDTYKDNTSLFEYKEILGVINTGSIKQENYKEFRLFYDPNLEPNMKIKDIKKRLDENNSFFEKIDQSIRFGDIERDLDSYFTDKLVDKIKKVANKENWETEITYKDIEEAVEEKQKTKDIEIKEIEIYINGEKQLENIDYVVKGIGSEKAQKKSKDILIFNPDKCDDIRIFIKLNKTPKKESIKQYCSKIKATTKKVEAVITHIANTCSYESIRMTDDSGSSKAKVNICIIDLPRIFVESLITTYTLKVAKKQEKCFIYTNNEEEEITFNEKGIETQEFYMKNDETYRVSTQDKVVLYKTASLIPEDQNEAIVTLNIDELELRLGINDESRKPIVITGLGVWKAKMASKCNLIYKSNNRILDGPNEYYTRDEFRDHLELEEKILQDMGVCWRVKEGKVESLEVELDAEVKTAYYNFVNYFIKAQTLPSLTYYNDELKVLGTKYIASILNCMQQIKDGESLPKSIKNIMKLGALYCGDYEDQIKYTPISPLNVAYQLQIIEEVDEEILKNDSLLKKLTSIYLLPYIQDEYKVLYKPIEQWHSPEWSCYVGNSTKKYKGARTFVSKLVKEKIDEFVEHFSYLFEQNHHASIKINLINTGTCREVFQGIVSYYTSLMKKATPIANLNPVEINIYSTGQTTHAFEEFSNYIEADEIKEYFAISLDTNGCYTESDVVDVIRQKIKFYDKQVIDRMYEYAHITFLEMNQKSDTGIGNMSEISTGVSLNGLVSGVPSVLYSDSYRTGYGMRYINESNNLIKLTRVLNSIGRVAYTSNPYYKDQCITTELDKHDEQNLEKVYNSSNWVTFIEPKVDLNFFKTSEASQDLMIIHYSDQYTTSSGYDAITVTRKSKQYQSVIEEHLAQKGVNDAAKYTKDIINMFNAVNGDWLLKLISTKTYFDKEKISILSAIKLSLAYFYHQNIIWVPISLEELLRVSGGAGLKKSEGIFSAINLGFSNNGATSDDIMLIGLENHNEELKIHYYPVEVKIGINSNNYVQKAIEQVKNTKSIFIETLKHSYKDIDLKTRIYRNFMMQLVIVSIEKLKLYKIWNDQDWDRIIASDIRRKLLNEEYIISTELDDIIGKGAVISFKKNLQFRSIKKEEDVTILEFTEEDGINYMTKGISEIRDELLLTSYDINKSQLLANAYSEDKTGVIEPNKSNYIIDVVDTTNIEVPLTDEPIVKKETDGTVNTPMKILFGTNQTNNQSVVWYPNDTDKVFHTNTGIIGTMGTGKTQFTKSLITQLYREGKYNLEGKDLGILVFDYKGDYNKTKKDFIDATNAKVYELYHLPFNPLSIIKTEHPRPMLPLQIASSLKETLAKGFNLGPIQSNFLKDLIMEAYEAKGIIKNQVETWDRIPPTLQDVYNIYREHEDSKQNSLYAAFSNLIEFEIFEPDATKTQSLFDLLDGVTVIDLSGYDESTQNLVVAITLDLFYSQMQSVGHSKIDKNIRQLTKLILVDEADNFLSKDFNALKKILKEGREFGVGTILSTQLLSHFATSDNDYANYILTWVVHNVADLNTRDVKYIFNTKTKQEEEELYNKIKSLKKHYSLVKMGDSDRSLHIRDKAFWELDK